MSQSNAHPPSELYIRTLGRGTDLVLVHGWGMHSGIWEDVIEALVDDYRVTYLDLPGYGYSRFAGGEYSLESLSRTLAALSPPKAVWIGWSLGGMIAQRLAIDAPERVAKLVLIGSSPCFVRRPDWPHALDYRMLHAFAENLSRDYRATLKRFLALEVHGGEHEVALLRQLRELVFQHGEPDTEALRTGLTILETADLRAELRRIACPALLLLGRRDNLVPVAAGAATCRLLPNARLHVFERAAHAPFFSHLAEFISHLRAFLDD
ncbi:MAG: pimeloyl-ACP methyl ester esterase BioH [Candidatus Competibacteraceae bacterium]